MVNEPSVFEPLKFYPNYGSIPDADAFISFLVRLFFHENKQTSMLQTSSKLLQMLYLCICAFVSICFLCVYLP